MIGDSAPIRTLYSVPVAFIIAALAFIVFCVLYPPEELPWIAAVMGFLVLALVILPGALCSGLEWKTHKVRRVTGLTFVTIGAIVVLQQLDCSTRSFVIAVLMGMAWGLIERLAMQSGDS